MVYWKATVPRVTEVPAPEQEAPRQGSRCRGKAKERWQKAKAKTSDLYSAQVKGLNPLLGDSDSRTDFAFISPDRQVVGVAGHRGNEVKELPIVVADHGRRFFGVVEAEE